MNIPRMAILPVKETEYGMLEDLIAASTTTTTSVKEREKENESLSGMNLHSLGLGTNASVGATTNASVASNTNMETSTRISTDARMGERQRQRAIRNRESAQASREKRRRYIVELEAERDALNQEARMLRIRVEALEREKSVLGGELNVLRAEFEAFKAFLFSQKTTTIPTINNKECSTNERNLKRHKDSAKMDRKNADLVQNGHLAELRVVRPGLGTVNMTCDNSQRIVIPIPSHCHQQDPLPQILAHSPSIVRKDDHLLVVPDLGGLPLGQTIPGLHHVLRLRLRYRRGSLPGRNAHHHIISSPHLPLLPKTILQAAIPFRSGMNKTISGCAIGKASSKILKKSYSNPSCRSRLSRELFSGYMTRLLKGQAKKNKKSHRPSSAPR